MAKWVAAVVSLVLGALAVPSAGAELEYVGSSTIGEHVIPDAAKAFTAKTGIPFGRIETQGSGRGLALVLRGEAVLAGVARSLTPEEKAGRIHYQIIGYDAVGIFVHPDNPVATLTRRQLKAIYTGAINNWKEVGGPDARIVCITGIWGEKRALMLDFQADVMDGAAYRADRRELDRQTEQVAVLRGERHGITAVSFAFAGPGIQGVAIEGFPPEPRHVRSGAYLLSRPLLLVTPAPPRAEVRRFLAFTLSAEGQAIVARTFVPVR